MVKHQIWLDLNLLVWTFLSRSRIFLRVKLTCLGRTLQILQLWRYRKDSNIPAQIFSWEQTSVLSISYYPLVVGLVCLELLHLYCQFDLHRKILRLCHDDYLWSFFFWLSTKLICHLRGNSSWNRFQFLSSSLILHVLPLNSMVSVFQELCKV